MRHFIVIDNESQDSEIENVEGKAAKEGFNVKGSWFDPTDHSCLTMIGGSLLIDKAKVLEQLDSKYRGAPIDLVLLDFRLGDEQTDGVELASIIRTDWRKGKVPLIMYSGDYDLLMEKLSEAWHPEKFAGDFQSQFKTMQKYFKHFPIDTFKREKEFSSILVDYLKKIPVNMERILLEKLNEYPDEIFQNIQPRFANRKLKEIVTMIEEGTGDGEEFKFEIMERAIAHYIFISE